VLLPTKKTAFFQKNGDEERKSKRETCAEFMKTILCIDDDADVLEMYQDLLERKGYAALTAPHGDIGIALCRQHALDAVVLDFNMHGMDGPQVAAAIRLERPNLPIVICSGAPDHLHESMRSFADALVRKGDGPAALLAAIEKVTDRYDS
jgi:CheY-like chemotaxis protein